MQQNEVIKKVVIVGGGTAGWLAANHLAKNLVTSSPTSIEVTLIESPNIPTIGVGEGTVPLMRQSLQALGISETDFITQCDATFKQGIKFVDWVHNPTNANASGRANFYHHIFDYPQINNINLTPYWLKAFHEKNQTQSLPLSFVDAVSIQGKICCAGLAPKLITTPEYQGLTAYAYHLDAGKFSALLANNATKKLGVKHVLADVTQVNQHANGDIKSVNTDTAGEFSADLFIDCTGFSALLIGKTLGVKFVDKSDVLFADHAVVMQVPYENEQSPIASSTISTALTSGWVWDIGLQHRRGIGHVYSSSHMSHDQAEQDMRNYVKNTLGAKSHINSDAISTRVIKMNIGHRDKFWQNNCVALGLAQGFVEPLEATGLLVFDATAKMLAEQFPATKTDMPLIAEQFNQRVTYSWEKVIDFVKLHYCISKRDDSAFWLDNRAQESIPDSLKQRLSRWAFQPPTQYDFFSGFEIFNLENYLYVLYGMEYPTDIALTANRHQQENLAKQVMANVAEQAKYAEQQLPTNRDLINKIHKHGLQKI